MIKKEIINNIISLRAKREIIEDKIYKDTDTLRAKIKREQEAINKRFKGKACRNKRRFFRERNILPLEKELGDIKEELAKSYNLTLIKKELNNSENLYNDILNKEIDFIEDLKNSELYKFDTFEVESFFNLDNLIFEGEASEDIDRFGILVRFGDFGGWDAGFINNEGWICWTDVISFKSSEDIKEYLQ